MAAKVAFMADLILLDNYSFDVAEMVSFQMVF
jgi:hypothetical protein